MNQTIHWLKNTTSYDLKMTQYPVSEQCNLYAKRDSRLHKRNKHYLGWNEKLRKIFGYLSETSEET